MIGIVIQARMGSSRLPGKVLKEFGGMPFLEYILNRLDKRKSSTKVIIATSTLQQDNLIEEFCKSKNVLCFRGDEQNVLKRYYDCAKAFCLDSIVRMTGDNPFPDIEELDKLVAFHKEKNLDYSENLSVLPVGVGMEIMSYTALQESYKKATLPKHFEHVNEYILDNLMDFRHGTLQVSAMKNRPDIKLTVDTMQDYDKACFILSNAQAEYVDTEQAIAISHVYDQLKRGKKINV